VKNSTNVRKLLATVLKVLIYLLNPAKDFVGILNSKKIYNLTIFAKIVNEELNFIVNNEFIR